MDPDLPVLEGSLEVLDVELIGKGRTIELETVGDLLTLRRLEKLGGLRVVVHGEVGDDGNDESQDTLQDEEPAPSIVATNTLHLQDTTSQKTTESTGGGSSGEENGHAETALVTPVPHCDVVGNTREETALGKTQARTHCHQAMVILDNAHKGAANTPGNHDGWDPDGGAEALHGHVGGDLSKDVEGEEDAKRIVVLEAGELQVLRKELELGIADIRTVEEG
ncbi:unnamed protein product [Sordaria macrospora k-hell]|uniref:WGS project CABT00000000 data, contig 2.22 n=1 Tax=Sordaria macrospora (strain ATCC MYA-333 / DSM 997 / K(L3346) / K-hell) TaxID=771870 RepID=F7W2K6_SORMK|nr:uncharacterized protein SMAC_12747 [Sordaria macrospora k-hell]CCC11857.1 unnamed protein product [Sordaria macrospora k-hell]